jgi:uncharacterized repeat protein (TIGR03803 family)
VFKITPAGILTTLHSFDETDGYYPVAALMQASDGNLYGTTYYGGAYRDGTVFKITPAGTLTVLHSFDGTDGEYPAAGLVQAGDGNLYGTTVYGGPRGNGTVFKITLAGTLTTLYSFDITDGSALEAGLLQATNGSFYGTTSGGGTNLFGTVFGLSVGLGQFLQTEPMSGEVGTRVIILGNNLKGASKVSFNNRAATFTVVSSSEIMATVPKGATTGKVKVKTASATLSTNVNFQIP